eukprot:2687167-Rhodomonas_salina.1
MPRVTADAKGHCRCQGSASVPHSHRYTLDLWPYASAVRKKKKATVFENQQQHMLAQYRAEADQTLASTAQPAVHTTRSQLHLGQR